MKNIVLLGMLMVAVLAGCGKRESVLIPGSGTLKDASGNPMADVLVRFVPDVRKGNLDPTSSEGITDASGKFVLKTSDAKRDGVVAGSHRVLLIDMNEERPAQGEESTKEPRIPMRFVTEAGGIEIEVSEGKSLEIVMPDE